MEAYMARRVSACGSAPPSKRTAARPNGGQVNRGGGAEGVAQQHELGQAQRVGKGQEVARVIGKAITLGGLVALTPPAQVKRQHAPIWRQPLGQRAKTALVPA